MHVLRTTRKIISFFSQKTDSILRLLATYARYTSIETYREIVSGRFRGRNVSSRGGVVSSRGNSLSISYIPYIQVYR